MEIKAKALTIEELRKMDGKPVWVEDLEGDRGSGWKIIYWDRGKYLVLVSKRLDGFLLDEYGETWLAYSIEPIHIEGKEYTAEWIYRDNWSFPTCSKCGVESHHVFLNKENFCSNCGRAMTDEAWEILNKRLKGSNEVMGGILFDDLEEANKWMDKIKK